MGFGQWEEMRVALVGADAGASARRKEGGIADVLARLLRSDLAERRKLGDCFVCLRSTANRA